jgi:hypothetical protein
VENEDDGLSSGEGSSEAAADVGEGGGEAGEGDYVDGGKRCSAETPVLDTRFILRGGARWGIVEL